MVTLHEESSRMSIKMDEEVDGVIWRGGAIVPGICNKGRWWEKCGGAKLLKN